LLHTILQQLAVLFPCVGYSSIPAGFKTLNDLKEVFHGVLSKLNQTVLFIVDSIENIVGVTSFDQLIPASLPKNIKFILTTNNLTDNLKSGAFSLNETKIFDKMVGLKVFQSFLSCKNKNLTEAQFLLIKRVFNDSRTLLHPFYVKLMFEIASTWSSYQTVDSGTIQNCFTVEDCIRYMFLTLEKQHGKMVFQKCLTYLTLFQNGIAECELEDCLSIDDELLTSIFQFHEIFLRRFPIVLWLRIKYDLRNFFIEKTIDKTSVIAWYNLAFPPCRVFSILIILVLHDFRSNAKFAQVSSQMYSPCDDALITNIIDYYIETWNQYEKEFQLSDYMKKKKHMKTDKAKRYTRPQRLIIVKNNQIAYLNMRKLNQLPYFVLLLRDETKKLTLFKDHILGMKFHIHCPIDSFVKN
jgi:hypothetical protein